MLPDWLGESEDPPLPGERIALKAARSELSVDEALADTAIPLPSMPVNASWPQSLGNATGVSGNLALNASISRRFSITPGEGAPFDAPLLPAPIVAAKVIYSMDGESHISAHQLHENGATLLWQSNVLVKEDDATPQIGGGLAWSRGRLFVTGTEGRFVALDSRDGSPLWQKNLLLPLRTPPRLYGNKILLLTADNQLLCLQQSNGSLLWSHQGISDITVPLHAAVPAVRDGVVLVTYSTGEVVALDQQNGQVLWSDQVRISSDENDVKSRSHVSPIMASGLSFLGSSERLAAYETSSGRRVWEREVPVKRAPWLAGNTLFLITPQSQIVAIRGTDGGIHWIRELPAEDDGDVLLWNGPIVAGGRVWMVADNGWLLSLDPQTGRDAKITDITSGVMAPPVIADNKMLLLTQESELLVFE